MRDDQINPHFVFQIEGAEVRLRPNETGVYVSTEFADGKVCGNWPHPDDPTYVKVAADCGFGPDQLLIYCILHEIGHLLVPRVLFGETGYVSRMSAEERKMSRAAAKAEEMLIYFCQVTAQYLSKAGKAKWSEAAALRHFYAQSVAARDVSLTAAAVALAHVADALELGIPHTYNPEN